MIMLILSFYDALQVLPINSIGVALVLLAFVLLVGVFCGVLSEVRAAKENPVATGVEGMIGEVGVVKEPVGVSSPGWIFVHGEWWQAVAAMAPEDAYEQDHEQVIKVGRKVLAVDLQDGRVAVMLCETTALESSTES